MFLIINNNKFNNKVIRLRKRGAKNIPIFDIVVMSKKQRRQGFFFDKLGYISIANKDHVFYLDSYKLAYWVSKGAYVHKNVKKYIYKFLVN